MPSTSHVPAARTIEKTNKILTSSPELELAIQFASTFSPQPNGRIAPQALRAYSLWHEQGLSISKAASVLRKPPIHDWTVITYVCDAISIGKLNFEPRRVIEFASEYSYQPFIKAHRDLFERARVQVWRAETIEARRASNN